MSTSNPSRIVDINGSPASFGLQSIGAHTSGTDISSAVVLTKPVGATAILLQTSGADIRFRLDGGTPTATVGFLLSVDLQTPVLIPVRGVSITLIQVAATATIQYQWVC